MALCAVDLISLFRKFFGRRRVANSSLLLYLKGGAEYACNFRFLSRCGQEFFRESERQRGIIQ